MGRCRLCSLHRSKMWNMFHIVLVKTIRGCSHLGFGPDLLLLPRSAFQLKTKVPPVHRAQRSHIYCSCTKQHTTKNVIYLADGYCGVAWLHRAAIAGHSIMQTRATIYFMPLDAAPGEHFGSSIHFHRGRPERER